MFETERHFEMDDFFENRTSKWNHSDNEHFREGEKQPQNPFLLFCDVILKYEKYKDHDDMNDSAYSPSSSDRTNDSFSSESESGFNSSTLSTEDNSSKVEEFGKKDWDLITCHCMKPFAGRPMIECATCETWLHMSCAKVRRNNVPDVFICQLCREVQETKSGSKRRSERIRSDDRRLLSA